MKKNNFLIFLVIILIFNFLIFNSPRCSQVVFVDHYLNLWGFLKRKKIFFENVEVIRPTPYELIYIIRVSKLKLFSKC